MTSAQAVSDKPSLFAVELRGSVPRLDVQRDTGGGGESAASASHLDFCRMEVVGTLKELNRCAIDSSSSDYMQSELL